MLGPGGQIFLLAYLASLLLIGWLGRRARQHNTLEDFARLAALVPRPRVNLTRYHGVFAPSSRLRGQITPARRGKGACPGADLTADNNHEPARPRQSMTWPLPHIPVLRGTGSS